jgi:hypothetical protein
LVGIFTNFSNILRKKSKKNIYFQHKTLLLSKCI